MDFEMRSRSRQNEESPEVRAAVLRDRIRHDELSQKKVELMAILGDQASQSAIGYNKIEAEKPRVILNRAFEVDPSYPRFLTLQSCRYLGEGVKEEDGFDVYSEMLNFLESISNLEELSEDLSQNLTEYLDTARDFGNIVSNPAAEAFSLEMQRVFKSIFYVLRSEAVRFEWVEGIVRDKAIINDLLVSYASGVRANELSDILQYFKELGKYLRPVLLET